MTFKKAKTVFNIIMRAIFKGHTLTLETKIIHLRCFVYSILLYNVEFWNQNEINTKMLKAFKIWRILKIPQRLAGYQIIKQKFSEEWKSKQKFIKLSRVIKKKIYIYISNLT